MNPRVKMPVISSLLLLIVTTWQVSVGNSSGNMLANPSFEEDLSDTWKANGFTMERYTGDTVDGQNSVRCTGRSRDLEGPIQVGINLIKGHHYVFEGYVKILNDKVGKVWQSFKTVLQMNLPGQVKRQSYIIAYRGFVQTSNNWILLKGSLEAPMLDPSDVRIAIRGPDPEVAFLVDNLTLYEVEENPNWLGEAHSNIETYRKSNMNFNLVLPSAMTKNDIQLKISLKRHLFVFGAKIEEYELVKEPRNLYTELVYNFFNWATVQAYKWKFNKGGRYDPDFSRATRATTALLENGMKVRGHSIFWDMEKNVPDWVKQLPDEELLPELERHVNYMMNLADGRLEQFDVQNEHIHGHYYEDRLQDSSVTKNMFRLAKQLAPESPDLYLNDFTCITSGANTEDLHDLAMEYLTEGVPLDGLGIQGHTKEFVKPDPTSMWRRIDRLAETGLDLMMTEFDIGWPDEVQRADWLEDTLRAFFGHPSLKGVILWGFWNGSMRNPHHELITGPTPDDLTILESGERWACLTQKEWTTKVTKDMRDSDLYFDLRGFQGDYEVIVEYQGVPVQRETFSLEKEDATVNIAVNEVTGDPQPIDIAEKVDYVPQCISHRAESTLGSDASSSSDVTLTCRTEQSSASGPGEEDAVSVGCQEQEVMTGCNSYHQATSWTRKGEQIEMDASGRPHCTAYNGRNSPGGVVVQARCCRRAGLSCDYRAAGPSFPLDGAMAEVRCLAQQLALGCSVYQPFPDSDGVRPSDDLNSCVAQSGPPVSASPAERSGAYVFSACCDTTSSSSILQCTRAVSVESGTGAGAESTVSCPPGYTMTACNAFADSGRPAGASISTSSSSGEVTCKAMLGDNLPEGSTGVKAYATCCQ